MKKLLILAVAFVLATTMFSCGNATSASANDQDSVVVDSVVVDSIDVDSVEAVDTVVVDSVVVAE